MFRLAPFLAYSDQHATGQQTGPRQRQRRAEAKALDLHVTIRREIGPDSESNMV